MKWKLVRSRAIQCTFSTMYSNTSDMWIRKTVLTPDNIDRNSVINPLSFIRTWGTGLDDGVNLSCNFNFLPCKHVPSS